jgi:uncharacterized protein (DUF1697 family)
MRAVRHIAFLRGVNLGKNKRVAMPKLRELLAEAGYDDVQTYVNSGNVILTSGLKPAKLEQALERQLKDGLGLDTRVLVRTRDELADVIERDPIGKDADNPSRYQVNFLEKALPAKAKRELEAADVAPERAVVDGREIYAWHPGGVGRSALATLLTEKKLGVCVTARNWRTVTKLLELADG